MTAILLGTKRGLYRLGENDPTALADKSVTALSSDAGWAVVDGRELWRSVLRGEWERVTSSDMDLRCVEAVNDEVYAGSAEAHLLRYDGATIQVVDDFEQVEGREDWFTPWGGPPDVRSIAASDSGELFVNVHVGGIVKGRDDKWEPTVDISADVHEVRIARDRIIAACAVGLAESGDGGYAWSYDDEGLHATYARAIAVGNETLFMSVSRGPRGGDAAIYRQPLDGTQVFERCDLPPFQDNIDTGCLDAHGDDVVFGTREGEVYLSSDCGATWEKVRDSLPPVTYVRFAEAG